MYIDYDYQYGGINVYHSDITAVRAELYNLYTMGVKNHLSLNEQNHYEALLNIIYNANVSADVIISFLADSLSDNDYSELYNDFLSFAQNTYTFYYTEGYPTTAAEIDVIRYLDITYNCPMCGNGYINTCPYKNKHWIDAYAASGHGWVRWVFWKIITN